MHTRLSHRLVVAGRAAAHALRRRLQDATRPAADTPIAGTLADLIRSKPELVVENMLLRQRLVILRRSVKHPRWTPADQALLVLLASRLRTWRLALLIVQPDTLLRWHRELFRCVWRRKSRTTAPVHRPPLAPETIALIREMAAANRTWGAERIRGELLKLDIRVAKWTIQKYMRVARPPRHAGQTWANFLPVTDLLFRPIYAFFVIELASRRVVHVSVTRRPSDAWVAQQLREATPFGQHPKHLIRDNDAKYGPAFAAVAAATGIDEVRTAYRAPKENAICERFLGWVRRECLDHLLVLSETHLRRMLREYVAYFNSGRPHQGLQQRIPDPRQFLAERPAARKGPVDRHELVEATDRAHEQITAPGIPMAERLRQAIQGGEEGLALSPEAHNPFSDRRRSGCSVSSARRAMTLALRAR